MRLFWQIVSIIYKVIPQLFYNCFVPNWLSNYGFVVYFKMIKIYFLDFMYIDIKCISYDFGIFYTFKLKLGHSNIVLYGQYQRMRIFTSICYKAFILALIIKVKMTLHNTVQCILLPSLLWGNDWGIFHE